MNSGVFSVQEHGLRIEEDPALFVTSHTVQCHLIGVRLRIATRQAQQRR